MRVEQRVVRLAATGILAFVVLAGGHQAAWASPTARVEASVPRSIALPMADSKSPPPRPELSASGILTNVAAIDLAQAMGINPSDVVSATFRGSDPRAYGIGTSPLGGFPNDGLTFAIMSTGLAESAYVTNTSGSLSYVLDGLDNSAGKDLVQLELFLQVPVPRVPG